MVPFPAAHGAAGAPMEWTLVAPSLELPLPCAALAALANRARPAVRRRAALPQKRRDWGPPLRCAQWGSKKEYRNCRQFRYSWYGVRDSTCAAAQATSG